MKRQLLIVMTSLLLLMNRAVACSFSCDGLPVLNNPLDAAPVIFVGRVVDVFPRYLGESVISQQTVFVVERSWKGIYKDVVTMDASADPASCGMEYKLGESYLIFAGGENNTLSTNLITTSCAAHQANVSGIKNAITVFGEGKVHPKVDYIPVKIRRQRALLVLLGLTLLMPLIVRQTYRLKQQRQTL